MDSMNEPTTTPEEEGAAGLLGPRSPRLTSLVRADLAGRSNQGRVRANNEDHFLIVRFGRFLEQIDGNLPDDDVARRLEEFGYALVVADGVGGAEAGEVASRLAIKAFVNAALETPDWILLLEDEVFSSEVIRRTKQRYRRVGGMLNEQAGANPALKGFGTTMTLALTLGEDVFVAHVGDSRAYCLREGTLIQLTRDHTTAQSMADQGIIRQAEVATHRLRHILTRALGAYGKDVEPDVHRYHLQDQDRLLLCTDGLTDMVNDQTIARILGEDRPAGELSQLLIDEALNAGGKDNVTAVVACYRFDQPSTTSLGSASE
jgi:protein phosphatase